jgi:hypothetical protein
MHVRLKFFARLRRVGAARAVPRNLSAELKPKLVLAFGQIIKRDEPTRQAVE